MHKKLCFIGWLAALLLLVGCQPKTDLDRIDALKKQVNKDVRALNDLNTNTFVQLEKDFISCDSSLQFLPEEELDAVFEKLKLVDAYIQQFKMERPVMQAEMDSTLARLDLQVEKLNSQVEYFKDRLGNCRKDLDNFKKKK